MFSTQNFNVNEYDQILLQTLNFLQTNWLNPQTGIVACCLVDGNKKAFATSTKNGDYWRHAELNAYLEFKKQYATEPSSSATFVVTLSPCLDDLKHRHEDSCTHLLNEIGVKRVHFGVLDSMHADSLNRYRQAGLTPSLTNNQYCSQMCEKLMALFSQYDSRINTDLVGIKEELGESFFAKNQFKIEM